jgi:parallel beta-helix repeat protein
MYLNKCSRTVVAAVLSALTGGIGVPSVFAAAAVVGNCAVGFQYPTIQAAVSASPAKSTIRICPGTYPEQVTINKTLTLVGLSFNNSDAIVITPPLGGLSKNATSYGLHGPATPAAAQVYVSGDANGLPSNPSPLVNITNVIVDGSGNQLKDCAIDIVGFYYQDASGTLDRVTARNQQADIQPNGCQIGLGIFVESNESGGTSNLNVKHSSVHTYQKNGITGQATGTTMNISGNFVQGYGSVNFIAQNGIQVSYGASGTISGNTVIDDFFSPNTFASTGILLLDSANDASVTGNAVSDTNLGVVLFDDGTSSSTDDSITVATNRIVGTQYDGIDACSNNNMITSNTLVNSGQSAIHFDTTSGCNAQGNTASDNVITEACAGVLKGVNSGNTSSENKYYDTEFFDLAGDSCPAISASSKPRVSVATKASGKPGVNPVRR